MIRASVKGALEIAKSKLWSPAESRRKITELKASLAKLASAKDPEIIALVEKVQNRIRAYEIVRPHYDAWVKEQKKTKGAKPKM